MKKIYKVVAHGRESPFYEVSLDIVETKAICTCHMLEFVGIICRHIAKPIADVLPNATHRLCMWHLLQKVLQ